MITQFKGQGAIKAVFGPTTKFQLICRVVTVYHRPSENGSILSLSRIYNCSLVSVLIHHWLSNIWVLTFMMKVNPENGFGLAVCVYYMQIFTFE